MKRHVVGLLGAALAVAVVSCVEDPTAALRDGPERIVLSKTFMLLSVGDESGVLTARAVDGQGNPVAELPVVSSDDETVVVVEEASAAPLPQKNFVVRAVGSGLTTVTATSGGVSGTLTVGVTPSAFTGTIAVNSAGRIDTVTVSATSLVTFDPDETGVLVNGAPVDVISLSANEVKFVASNAQAVSGATVTLENTVFLGSVPVASLDAATPVNLTADDDEPANSSSGTPTAIALNTTERGSISGTDANDYWVVTVATAGNYTFRLEFPGSGPDPDADVIIRNHATGALVGFAASLANPETTTIALDPGDYRIQVNLYDSGGAPEPHWYRLRVSGP